MGNKNNKGGETPKTPQNQNVFSSVNNSSSKPQEKVSGEASPAPRESSISSSQSPADSIYETYKNIGHDVDEDNNEYISVCLALHNYFDKLFFCT